MCAKERNLHFYILSLVRLYGHAGADLQQTYLAKSIFEEWEQNDPLLHSARLLTEGGVLTTDEALSIYTETEEQCARVAEEVIQQRRLSTAAGGDGLHCATQAGLQTHQRPICERHERLHSAATYNRCEKPQPYVEADKLGANRSYA